MNKTELIAAAAEGAGLTKKDTSGSSTPPLTPLPRLW